MTSSNEVFDSAKPEIYQIKTRASGPGRELAVDGRVVAEQSKRDLFGLSQNAGMGWNPAEVGRKQFLILSTQGGLRAPDGKPIALGYHTGHWEIGLLVHFASSIRILELADYPGMNGHELWTNC